MTATIANNVDLCDVRREAETHRINQDFLTRLLDGEQADRADIIELLDLDDTEFRQTVAECLADSDDDDWIALLAPPVRSRTLSALGQLRFIIQGGLTKAANEPHRGRYSREALLNQMERIDRRVRQAKWLKSHEHTQRAGERVDTPSRPSKPGTVATIHAFREATEALLDAVQHHRLAAVAAGLEPEPHDRALWAVLDAVQVPHGVEVVSGTEVLRRKVTREKSGSAS